jgi:Zn-dependent protease
LLLFNLDQLLRDPLRFLELLAVMILALIVGITVHEASHALVATSQGDNTARSLGRLSLNPLRHMDPLGSAALLLIGFGWGKPVPFNPHWLKSGPRIGGALVAFAGPASNFLLAGLVALPFRLGMVTSNNPFWALSSNTFNPVDVFLYWLIHFNIVLGVFNLIPLHPLDGFKVALGALPREIARSFARLEPYGPGILMTLLVMGMVPMIGFGIGDILKPLVRLVSIVVVGRPM